MSAQLELPWDAVPSLPPRPTFERTSEGWVVVPVPPHIVRAARAFAVQCNADSRAHGCSNKFGLADEPYHVQIARDTRGKIGEWAYRRYLGRLPVPPYVPLAERPGPRWPWPDKYKAPDIDPDIEVKCGERSFHRLLCRPNDTDDARRFAWSVYDDRTSTCTLRGWQYCGEIKRIGTLDARDPDKPWWLLADRFLNPVDTLVD